MGIAQSPRQSSVSALATTQIRVSPAAAGTTTSTQSQFRFQGFPCPAKNAIGIRKTRKVTKKRRAVTLNILRLNILSDLMNYSNPESPSPPVGGKAAARSAHSG